MKLMVKFILLAVIAAIVAPFFIHGPNGQTLLKFSDFIPSTDSLMESVSPADSPKLYKWKNEKGQWQFGDNPPADAQATVMQVTTPVNSMKTIELPKGFSDSKPDNNTKRFDPLDSNASPLSTAPLQKVPEMLETIDGFQQSLDDRKKALDAL